MGYMVVLVICLIRYISSGDPDSDNEGNFSVKNNDTRFVWKGKQLFQSRAESFTGIFSQKTEQCNKDFITKLSHLLNMFNISLPLNNIEHLRTFMNVKAGSRGKPFGLHFVTILHIKGIYSEYGDKEVKKVYEANDLTSQMEKPLFLDNFSEHNIDNLKVVLIANNIYPANISCIQIKLDIKFAHAPAESEKISEKTEILSNFFGSKRKWRKNKLKVKKFSSNSIYFATFLALVSSTLCGFSFAIKKKSLIKMDNVSNYYFNKNWWFGHSLMVIGDTLHLMAFYFAPTIIVCTLQILTVIVAALATISILGEKMHKYGKIGIALSISGCWVIVFHVPNEPHVYSIETFLYMLSDHIFLIYIAILSIVTALLTSFFIPKYGKSGSLGYTFQSAIFGSIIVLGLKGIILGYTDTLSHWLPWTSLSIVIVLLLIQLEYLNRALSMYNTLVVTTQYYVLYSAFVIFASSLLFKVWVTSSYEKIFTNICGLLTVGLGAFILTIFEEKNATFDFSRLFVGPE